MMRGWKNEGWRHSLAARGVRTGQKRYLKGRIAGAMSTLLDVKKTDEETMFKMRMLDQVREESMSDLNQAISRGELTADDAARFWKDDFEPEKELFMNNGQPMEQFRANVSRKRKSHIERFGKVLPVGLR